MVEEDNMLGMLQTIVLSMIMGSIAVVPLIIVFFVLIPYRWLAVPASRLLLEKLIYF